MGEDFPTEDKTQDAEKEIETAVFQRDNWTAAHSTTLTANAQTMVQTMGQHVEGAVIAASGGGRGNDSGGVPTVVQTADGQTLAMEKYKNTYAADMLDNRIALAQDQTENRARVDARLLQEIKERSPIVAAFAAGGDLKQVTAMVAKLSDQGPVPVTPGGPGLTNGSAGPTAPAPVIKNDFALT